MWLRHDRSRGIYLNGNCSTPCRCFPIGSASISARRPVRLCPLPTFSVLRPHRFRQFAMNPHIPIPEAAQQRDRSCCAPQTNFRMLMKIAP